ncbi:hypothetical protein CRYUN_Cryun03dG0089500 [Craigia yunnanensis]
MRQRKNDSSKKHPNLSEEEEKEKQEKKFPYSSKNVLAICLGFRMLNALLIQTYFNSDEHWQALEVAHRIAFGYGHLTWGGRREFEATCILWCSLSFTNFLHYWVLIHHGSW